MKYLLFLRQLLANNFYRNPTVKNKMVLVMVDVKQHSEFNVGQCLEITSVNRTTGEIGIKHYEY